MLRLKNSIWNNGGNFENETYKICLTFQIWIKAPFCCDFNLFASYYHIFHMVVSGYNEFEKLPFRHLVVIFFHPELCLKGTFLLKVDFLRKTLTFFKGSNQIISALFVITRKHNCSISVKADLRFFININLLVSLTRSF